MIETARVEPTTSIPPIAKRASWGAIIAGVALMLGAQTLFSLIGMLLGLTIVDPQADPDPARGFGMAAGVYFVISSIVSLFIGGYTAGSLATVQTTRDRLLHGLLTWGVGTILLFLLMTTSFGALIGGTAALLGKGHGRAVAAAMTDRAGMTSATPGARGTVSANNPSLSRSMERGDGNGNREQTLDLWPLRDQLLALLWAGAAAPATNASSAPPDQAGQPAPAVVTTTDLARQAAFDPATSDATVTAFFDRLEKEAPGTWPAADREALINTVQTRTGLARSEAQRVVANYEQAYQGLRAQWQQKNQELQQSARELAEAAARGVKQASLWTSIMLLLGAIAAAWGAGLGARGVLVVTQRNY